LKNELPIVYLARHSETSWTLSGQHTGLIDLPLTEHGERAARRLGEHLQGLTFAKVFTSPLQRARRTCELAGLGPVAEFDPDLVEWDYGKYEGRRGAEIRAERLNSNLFRDGCPGGETPQLVSARADRVVSRVRAIPGDVALARARTDSQQPIFHVEHGEPQCLGLRKRSLPAGDPILERRSPRRH
jgi:probable phosphoglycerate mutase